MISEDTVFDTWKTSVKKIRQEGKIFTDTEGRGCVELQNVVIKLTEEMDDIEAPLNYMNEKQDFFYPSKQELVSSIFKKNINPFYGYTYGNRIFNFGNKMDQVEDFLIPLLEDDKNTRRGIISFYNPLTDSKPLNKDMPGIIYMQVRVIDEKVCLNVSIRSNDLFFGWPANLFQLRVFQDYIGDKLGFDSGSLYTISNSAHVFKEDYKYMEGLV